MEYKKVLERIANDETVDAAGVMRAVGNAGLSMLDLLCDMRDVVQSRFWCSDCQRRGVVRNSNKKRGVSYLICPSCKKKLGVLRRDGVYTHHEAKKLLAGSAEDS